MRIYFRLFVHTRFKFSRGGSHLKIYIFNSRALRKRVIIKLSRSVRDWKRPMDRTINHATLRNQLAHFMSRPIPFHQLLKNIYFRRSWQNGWIWKEVMLVWLDNIRGTRNSTDEGWTCLFEPGEIPQLLPLQLLL